MPGGILDDFAHGASILANNVVVQFYPAGLTSDEHRCEDC
jgi:hypothetical protein